jgi:hypothetical protein
MSLQCLWAGTCAGVQVSDAHIQGALDDHLPSPGSFPTLLPECCEEAATTQQHLQGPDPHQQRAPSEIGNPRPPVSLLW